MVQKRHETFRALGATAVSSRVVLKSAALPLSFKFNACALRSTEHRDRRTRTAKESAIVRLLVCTRGPRCIMRRLDSMSKLRSALRNARAHQPLTHGWVCLTFFLFTICSLNWLSISPLFCNYVAMIHEAFSTWCRTTANRNWSKELEKNKNKA